jgi:hypothetical protein
MYIDIYIYMCIHIYIYIYTCVYIFIYKKVIELRQRLKDLKLLTTGKKGDLIPRLQEYLSQNARINRVST